MKKSRVCLGLLLGMLLLLPVAAMADGVTEYTVEEMDMTIEIPSDVYVIDRDFDIHDPVIAAMGLDGQDLKNTIHDLNIYLYAIQLDSAYTLDIIMKEEGINPDADLNSETDDALLAMADEWAEWGAVLTDSVYEETGFYRQPQAAFLTFSYVMNINDQDYRFIEYQTFLNGRSIKITLRINDPETISNPDALMKQVVDSISFQGAETASSRTAVPIPASRDELVYSSEEAGVTFTVPEGWSPDDLSEEREYIKTKYTNNSKSFIMFGYYDFFETLPEVYRFGLTRADCDNDIYTYDDIRDMLENESREIISIDQETISGVEYFRVHSTFHILGMEVDSFSHIMVHHGIHYEFDAMFFDESDAYDDYMEMLKSVLYSFPAAATSQPVAAAPPSSNNSDDSPYALLIGSLLLSLLYTITLYSVPILIYRFLIVKKPLPAAKAKKITIIYGIIALLIAIAVGSALGDSSPGGAVFVWSFINYFILKGGGPKAEKSDGPFFEAQLSESDRTNTPPLSANQSPKDLICPQCKTVVPPDSLYCSHCGFRII